MSFLSTQSIPLPIDVRSVFRKSEHVLAFLPCRWKADGPGLVKGYAIVVSSQGNEEAAVCLVIPHSSTHETRITHILPINPQFSLSLNQTPPSPSVSHFHQSSRPRMFSYIGLSLWSSRGKVDLRISAGESAKTQVVVNELKRLLAISKSHPASPLSPAWLGYYPVHPPSPDLDDEDAIPTPSESTSATTTPSIASTNISQNTLSTLTLSDQPASGPSKREEELDPLLPGFSRVQYLRQKVFSREEEWSTRRTIKIRIATYNVNDKLPPDETVELAPMVGEGKEDLLVFGFQEVDLRSSAMFVSQGNARSDIWHAATLRSLGEKASGYNCIATTQYVGVMMLVFARKDLQEHISGLETSEKGIGLLGFGGNKAGVAVRLKIHDTTFCFVNSHLAAFANALDRRRADYQTLKAGLVFPASTGTEDVLVLDEFGSEPPGKTVGIEDCHTIFWLGDLNYRIDEDDEVLKAWVKEERWRQFLEKDQLKKDIANGKSFEGYQEGDIDFPPSYKYVHGSSTLDTRRAPAYTDRILWKNASRPSNTISGPITSPTDPEHIPGSSPTNSPASSSSAPPASPAPYEPKSKDESVRCDTYQSHSTLLWSDHRPVSASFTVKVRVPDTEKRKVALNEVKRDLERLEAVWRPALEVGRTEIDFGEMRYRRQNVQKVILKNTGRVTARYSFKEPSPGKSICKPYYWVIPSEGEVEPGQSLKLRVVAFVHEDQARSLTAGEDMSDVLVLQVADGRDTFITLSATFLPTIIGIPLKLLSTLSAPIRDVPTSERRQLVAPRPASGDAPPTPDKRAKQVHDALRGSKSVQEIWRLLEYLMEYGIGQDLWINRDWDDEAVLDVIEAIDTAGSIIPPNSAHSVSLALLHILQSSPEPLIPYQWHPFCRAAKDRDDAFACLEGIEGVHTNILIGLMSVVRLCSSGSARAGDGKEFVQKIIDILADTIFGTSSTQHSESEKDGQARFVYLLLEG